MFILPSFNFTRASLGLIQKLSVNSKPSWLASCLAFTLARKNLVSNLLGSMAGVIQCAHGTMLLVLNLNDSDIHISLKEISLLFNCFLKLLNFSYS